ncbi:MAG: hypothetical protein Kow0042_19480 [Calditrichia bacterium]
MKSAKTSRILKYLFILLPGWIFLIALAQTQPESKSRSRLELLNADVSRGVVIDGKPLRILEGHVHARQDTLEIFCDQATYFEQERKILLKGKVVLIQGKDTLRAKEVTYFEESKIAIAEGAVRVNRPGQFLKCDYLEYHYNTEKVRATGEVLLHDAENRVYLTGKHAEYLPETKYSFIEKKAHLWQMDSSYSDTLHIYSRRMEYYFGDERRAIARDSVHIYQGILHAWSDSAIYFLDQEIAYLEKAPRAVQENNELAGTQMKLILEDLKLKQIIISGSARAISVEDSLLQKENRLNGREIIMFISEGRIRELWAISNASSFYYLKEGEEEKGMNTASADTIKAFFQENELDSILVIGGSQGTYYPQGYKGPIIQE